jgi:hypothetical protein
MSFREYTTLVLRFTWLVEFVCGNLQTMKSDQWQFAYNRIQEILVIWPMHINAFMAASRKVRNLKLSVWPNLKRDHISNLGLGQTVPTAHLHTC